MLGVLYILICFLSGFVICRLCFPQLSEGRVVSFGGRPVEVSSAFLEIPAWFLTGTISLTWIVYILACLFSSFDEPLFIANIIALALFVFLDAIGIYFLNKLGRLRVSFAPISSFEIIIFATVMVLIASLMLASFRVIDGTLYVGLSVFSDFTPHVSMIRSFSYGQNFPTAYSVCAGADVRYHFMFEFLAGDLEYLGMRIDHAFNIPSFLSLLSTYSLLYVTAVRITSDKSAGTLAMLFQTFRSSYTLFYYLSLKPKKIGYVDYLLGNTAFIGSTEHEDWGLWNLNVYCNQRHLALGLAVLLLTLNLMLPLLYAGFKRNADRGGIGARFKSCFLSADGWVIRDPLTAVCTGILLGSLAFWNGAVLIATLLVLFFCAALSDRRLEYLIAAVIALLLSLLQSHVFVDGSVVEPEYRYGFLCYPANVFNCTDYLLKLMGILPILLLVVFVLSKSIDRYLMFAFSTPIIFAFCVSLTPDIAVNHKYIMIAVMLLNIYAGWFISLLWSKDSVAIRILAVGLTLCLTLTGIYDYYVLLSMNKRERAIQLDLDNEITAWIRDNCDANDLFCTGNYYISGGDGSYVVLGGAMLYLAWQYYGYSAGYDTDLRLSQIGDVYSATSSEELRSYVSEYGFDYIIVDIVNRESEDYFLYEDVIADTFEAVFTTGEGPYRFTIYRTGI